MKPSRVRQRWAAGQPVLSAVNHFYDPNVAELISLMGFDCIWIDLEHHATGIEAFANMTRGARVGGADVMARPAKGEFLRMARFLEAGAMGIMYPRCESVEEAQRVVHYAKFPPLGQRGQDGGNADNPYILTPMDEYMKQANENTFIVIQIEHPDAIPKAGKIAETDGVDMLFFGPGDYSSSSGLPGQIRHQRVLEGEKAVCEAALAAGKRFGTVSTGEEDSARLLDLGSTFLTTSSELGIILNAYQHIQARYGKLGFSFGPLT